MQNGIDLTAVMETLTTLVSTWGLKLLGALVAFLVGRMVAGWARKGVQRGLERTKIDATMVPFISRLTYYAIITFVIIAALGIVGVETASLAVVLGAAGFAVGLALQGTLANFSSGLMLMIFRPVRVGDYVEVGGEAGTVKTIGVFSTTMDTPDNIRITIPNSSVYGQTIRNFTANDQRRIDLVMGISYDDDISVAVETMERVMSADERVLAEPEPVVAVHELADSSVNLVVRPWCRKEDYWWLRWDLTRAFKEELEGAGCSIPYPQRDVHVFETGDRTA